MSVAHACSAEPDDAALTERMAVAMVRLTETQGSASRTDLVAAGFSVGEVENHGTAARSLAQTMARPDRQIAAPTAATALSAPDPRETDDRLARIRAAMALEVGNVGPLTGLAFAGALGRAQAFLIAATAYPDLLGHALGAIKSARLVGADHFSAAVINRLDDLRDFACCAPGAAFSAVAPADRVAERAAEIPTVPGTPFGGGYYAGRISIDGKTYALIVAPKALGEHAGIAWKTNWRAATPGAQSLCDGLANSKAMDDDGHPAAHWARSLRVAGFDDWYLPARDELEICYRALKPTADENWLYGNKGKNASSVPPGKSYTKSSPTQTGVEAFREGAPEAFERASYWSSTEFGPANAWIQYFDDGGQGDVGKYGDLRARAVRKVLI